MKHDMRPSRSWRRLRRIKYCRICGTNKNRNECHGKVVGINELFDR